MQNIKRVPFLVISFSVLFALKVHAEMYQWVDKFGAIHFTDDKSKIPKATKAKTREPREVAPPASWVMVGENITGYIYQSWAFYDDSSVVKLSDNEWIVPVKVMTDNSGLAGASGYSSTMMKYQIRCSPRSLKTLEATTVKTNKILLPEHYTRHEYGAVYHESLVGDILMDIMCGKTPDSADYAKSPVNSQ